MAKDVYIKKLFVQLTDLSRIWTDNAVVGKRSENNTTTAFIPKEWQNKKIQEFYTKCVVPYAGSLPKKQRTVIESILELFDKSPTACQTPVISPADQETAEEHKFIRDCLLIDHTLNVAQESQVLHKRNNDHFLSMGSILIAALSHDLGKVVEIQKQFGKGLNNHVLTSGQWVQSYASGVSDYDKIYEAVCYHHAEKKELKARCDPGNFILSILKQANRNVRKKEINEALKRNEDKPKDAATTPLGKSSVTSDEDLIDFVVSSENGEGKQESGKQPKNLPSEQGVKKCEPENVIAGPDKERAFINCLDKKTLIAAVEQNISDNGLACFHFEGDVYIMVKAFHKIINDLRSEKKLPAFNSTEENRKFIQRKIQNIRNVHCILKFSKEKPRKPYRAYFYVIAAGSFDGDLIKNLKPAKDYKGCVLSEVKVQKEFGNDLKEPEERMVNELEESHV